MTAHTIDGNALARQIRDQVSHRTAALKARGIAPQLNIILVGEDPASQVYTRHKVNDSTETGLGATLERYPADLPEAQLLARIEALNQDPAVHGILVQLPLPAHLDTHKVIAAISPAKDVDGFHVASAGALMTGLPGFWPCTPHGCMKMLESIGMKDLRGKHAVVIDVGMNRNDAGKLCGDVDYEGVREVAGWITPVPGGVGPMTRAMLLVNTLEAAERASG